MAATKKKKKDNKEKDFQKPRLKVGKTKPKAANSTDTNFTSKSIKLKDQSLSVEASPQSAQFLHHVSLLHHHNASQVTESLAFLTKTLESLGPSSRIPLPVSELLPKLLFLTIHSNQRTREQFIRLLKALPSSDVANGKLDDVLLWVHAGMTSMSIDIRSSSLDVLDWLLKIAPEQTISLPGGWYKTMDIFTTLLGWYTRESHSSGWTHMRSSMIQHGREATLRAKQISALASFIKAGIDPPVPSTVESRSSFPLYDCERHMLSNQTGYAHLNIWGTRRSVEDETYFDREGRQRIFAKRFLKEITKGLEEAKRQGGQLGRTASSLEKVIDEAMANAEDCSDYDFEFDT